MALTVHAAAGFASVPARQARNVFNALRSA